MRYFSRLSAAVIFFSLLSLSCKNDISSPLPVYPNLVTNSAFEVNGKPSFYGWSLIWDSVNIHLSPDKPAQDSGQSALLITYNNKPLLSQEIVAPQGSHVYRFSFWAKTVPQNGWQQYSEVLVYFYRADSVYYTFVPADNSPNWYLYSMVSDTIDLGPNGKIDVALWGSNAYGSGVKQYYHNCKLELLY